MPITKTSAALRSLCFLAAGLIVSANNAFADALREVRERGVLRHLGVPYANFVTGGGDGLNDIVPAMLKRESDMTLLDVPDVLLALEIWPGQIRVIGPISGEQRMAAGFSKDSPELRAAFNSFLTQIKQDGTYMKLVRKYFRAAPRCLPEFFKDLPSGKK